MTNFAGRTILITGAAGGLGSAMAQAFAAEGGRIIVTDLDEHAAATLASGLGGGAIAARLDVTDEAGWLTLFETVARRGDRVDVVINNAGYFLPNIAFEDMTLEVWRRHFAINADGTFLGCKHAILHMKDRGGGAIVNLGSGMSLKAVANAAAYCGSKAAVLMTTRTAAAAAGKYAIRVNAILPGPVPTAMLRGNLLPGEDEQAFYAMLVDHGTLGRLATAEDIARGVLFLADARNGAISGIYLPVDAGDTTSG